MLDATFQNLGFELAGAGPGLAAGWVLDFRATAEDLAGYGVPERPQEDFERGWLGNEGFLFALAPSAVEPALYDGAPESMEDFEEGWSQNEAFLRELVSAAAAGYSPGPDAKLVEDFDGLWVGNEAFLTAFGPSDLAAVPVEGFEADWRGNGAFLFVFTPASLSAASYDPAGVAQPVEDFEELWPSVRMTSV